MAEPAERQTAVCRLVVSQLTHHLRLCSCVRQHVYEVDDNDVKVVLQHVVEMFEHLLASRRVVDLVIAERVVASEPFYLRLHQRLLIEVLALLLVLIDPQVRKHLCYLVGHQSAEDSVACILCGGGQDAGVDVVVDIEERCYLRRHHAPLVISEIVDHDEENLMSLVEQRKHLLLKDVCAHERTVCGCWRVYPVEIVLAYIFGEGVVGLLLLHLQHLRHRTVCSAQLHLPVNDPSVGVFPVVYGAARVDLCRYVLEILLITRLRHLAHDLSLVNVLLQREQNLHGVNRLDEVVGNL